MGDSNYAVGLKATWESDDAKLKDVVAAVNGLKDGLTELASKQREGKEAADEHTAALDGIQRKLVEMAAGYLSVRTAWEIVKESFQGAVNAEKTFAQLTNAAINFGGATKESAATLKPWAEQLERISGISKNEIGPEFTRLVSSTHDIAMSQDIVQIALGASARGMGALSENVTTLVRYMETGNVRGVGPFANLLRQAKESGEDLGTTLGTLKDKFGDAGAEVDTMAQQLARVKIAAEQSKEALGEAFAMQGTGGIASLSEIWNTFLGMVAAGICMAAAGAKETGAIARERGATITEASVSIG